MQRCPECDAPIEADAINIKEGVALCAACGELTRLSELNCSSRSMAEIIEQPPLGCELVPNGERLVVRAKIGTLLGCLTASGVALFWNGIVSVFVLVALAGLYTNLVGPLPAWFPAPELNDGKPEMNGQPMGLGMTLFLCVFLIPFVTIGTVMLGAVVLNLAGKVEVVLDETRSYAATGVGFLVWRRCFDPRRVNSIRLTAWSQSEGGVVSHQLQIVADRTIKFGGMLPTEMLPSERLEWMQVVLKQLLIPPRGKPRLNSLPELTWLPGQTNS